MYISIKGGMVSINKPKIARDCGKFRRPQIRASTSNLDRISMPNNFIRDDMLVGGKII